jgi:hypothetical protein
LTPGRKKLIVIFLLVIIFAYFVVRKSSSYLSDHVLKSLPDTYAGIDLEILKPQIKFYPPSVNFPSISGEYEKEEVFNIKDCKLIELYNTVSSEGRNISAVCKEGFVADKIIEMVKNSRSEREETSKHQESVQHSEKSKQRRSFSIQIDKLSFINDRIQKSFNINLKLENGEGILRFGPDVETESSDSGEVLFSAGFKKGDIRVDDFSIKTLRSIYPFFMSDQIEGYINGNIKLNSESGDITAVLDISIKDLKIENSLIDDTSFEIPFLRINGDLNYEAESKNVVFEQIKASIGGIEGELSGSFSNKYRNLKFHCEDTSLMKLHTVIADHRFEKFSVGGNVEATLVFEQEEDKLPEIIITGSLDEPVQYSDRLDYLKTEFIYKKSANKQRDVFVGPTNGYFVSFHEIPEYFLWAVVTAEDTGFFKHKGIDFAEISAAAKDNVKRKKMRGGSTITQQVVKNLFLEKEQTFVRKFKEMLLAVELDATLSKERILEIYLNIIEWAPDVFGIGEASIYYFGKPPMELSVLESVYLASIIPGPYLYHKQFLKDKVSDKWIRNLHRLLDRLHETEKITLDQYFESMKGNIVFREIDREKAEE